MVANGLKNITINLILWYILEEQFDHKYSLSRCLFKMFFIVVKKMTWNLPS